MRPAILIGLVSAVAALLVWLALSAPDRPGQPSPSAPPEELAAPAPLPPVVKPQLGTPHVGYPIRRLPDAPLDEQLAIAKLPSSAPIFIRIFKETRELEVWLQDGDEFRLFKAYEICAYSGDLGPKLREGDSQSPEGFYFVTPGSMNPNSSYHLSFNLGFPNAYDRAHGRTGSYLMVHGACVSIGCYAMTDEGIEEIYELASRAFDQGQPFFRVHIFPFRMSEANFARYAGARWSSFWGNLKEGHDLFERDLLPPDVTVRDRSYRFESTAPPLGDS